MTYVIQSGEYRKFTDDTVITMRWNIKAFCPVKSWIITCRILKQRPHVPGGGFSRIFVHASRIQSAKRLENGQRLSSDWSGLRCDFLSLMLLASRVWSSFIAMEQCLLVVWRDRKIPINDGTTTNFATNVIQVEVSKSDLHRYSSLWWDSFMHVWNCGSCLRTRISRI